MMKADTAIIRIERNAKGLEACIARLTQIFASAENGRVDARCPLVPIFAQGVFQLAEVEENIRDRIKLDESQKSEPVRVPGRR